MKLRMEKAIYGGASLARVPANTPADTPPDLAGKLAAAKRLTAESTREQASAGLDALTDAERELFSKLNSAYVSTFGFPFIIAVKGKTKEEILAAFEARIGNDRTTEFDTACKQVERIALLRLREILPS